MPNWSTASESTGRTAFGSTWRSRTYPAEAPLRRAASMNTLVRTRSTSERISRANTATAETPVAIAALRVS